MIVQAVREPEMIELARSGREGITVAGMCTGNEILMSTTFP